MTLLFRDVFYLDCAAEQSRRGDILVEGNRIGKIAAPRTLPDADETIDGRGTTALLPAFVNCHTHAAMTLLRGLGEEKPLMEWLKERIWPLEAHLTPEDIYVVPEGWPNALAPGLAAGARVVVEPGLPCETRNLPPCRSCREGRYNRCERFLDGDFCGNLDHFLTEFFGGVLDNFFRT